MAKDGMTLYEARRNKGGAVSGPSLTSPPALRIPFGIVAVVVVVIAGLVWGVYALGYRSGVAAGERNALEAGQASSRTIDPMLGSRATEVAGAAGSAVATLPAAGAQAADASGALGPPPSGDPRQAGLNYFIIAGEIAPDRAAEMVIYCRSMGLDAVAISGNNARSQVIVLPGFGRDERGGAPVKSLEAKIRAVGAKWKSLGRGNGDFRDFYPKLFKGQS